MSPPVARHEKRRVDLFGERLRSRTPQLSPRLLTVVNWIDDNREAVLDHTAMEIAAATQTSDATVVRAIQALGFAGLRDLKQTMQHWFGPTISSAEKMVTTVAALTSDVSSSIDFVLEGHLRACEMLATPDNRAAIAQAVALLSDARHVLNRTAFSLAEQLISLQRGDVLIMMGQKSPHREGLTTLREAERLGIPTILLTQATDSRFSEMSQVVIHVPRGENGRVPLHGTVMACLEMLVLSVASTASQRTIRSMKRIHDLHKAIGKSGGRKG